MAAVYYNLIAKHKIGGIIPSAIKYYKVSEQQLLPKIQYLVENYVVEVIFIYHASNKALAGWYRNNEPNQGLTWKQQYP